MTDARIFLDTLHVIIAFYVTVTYIAPPSFNIHCAISSVYKSVYARILYSGLVRIYVYEA